jgi:hypothetical protein
MTQKNSISFTYPIKILVAWGEAISGNNRIRDWLMNNGYNELGLFTFALRNNDEAMLWLIKNDFPHLAALINGIEGNAQALRWLDEYGFKDLKKMALAADNDTIVMKELMAQDKLKAMLAMKMGAVKDEIERDNNDAHKISPN